MRNWKQFRWIGGGAAALALTFLLGLLAGSRLARGAELSSSAEPEQPVVPSTFYAGSTINDIDVGGMTLEQAVDALNAGAASRAGVELIFADGSVMLDGADLGYRVADYQPLQALLEAQRKTPVEEVSAAELHLAADERALYECSRQAVLEAVSQLEELERYAGVEEEPPHLVYSSSRGAYRLEGGETVAGAVDAEALTDAVITAVSAGETALDVAGAGLYSGNSLLASSEIAQTALETANAQRNLSLTYTFGLEDGSHSGTETISRSRMRKWLQVGEDGLTLTVDEEAVLRYCEGLAEEYSDTSHQRDAQFVTTGGDLIPVRAAVNDRQVDAQALCQDILSCIDQLVEGERKAPYQSTASGVPGTTNLGGTYVEVDLDKQHLYLYKDGVLIAEGDICSGDVATGCETPTGLYTFNNKETDRDLRGADYLEHVDYWLPFYQDYGIHDASWRTYPQEFGGEVYLENGSHGCVNMPPELAKTVFENVEVGTYIILYGGQRSETE